MEEEFETHIELRTDHLVGQGMKREEAARRARQEFGSVEMTKDGCREALTVNRIRKWRRAGFEGGLQDLRDAYRSIRAAPLVSLIAVVSLGLGIGANTAVFSLVESLVLRPLPVRDPEQLVHINYSEETGRSYWATYAAWEEIRDRDLFVGAFAWSTGQFRLGHGNRADNIDALSASGEFFDVLGVAPVLGRGFTEADDRPGGAGDGAVAVLSHAFWVQHFGGSADVLGRSISLEGSEFTIIGVGPADFFGPEVGRNFDVVIPLATEVLVRGEQSRHRNGEWLRILARLKPGQSAEQATVALREVQPQIRELTLPTTWRKEYKDNYLEEPLAAVPAASGVSSLRGRYGERLLILMVVIGLVQFIACANVAHLMRARGTGRRRELSIRAALGASRLRLIRLLLTEAVLLAAFAAILGMFFGHWASRLLVLQMTTVLERIFLETALNGHVLAFTMTVGLVTAAVFGIIPAYQVTRGGPGESLKEQGSGMIRIGPSSANGVAVIAQVALSLTLLVAAGLFLRTFSALANLQLGFEPDRVLMVDVDLTRVEPSRSLDIYETVCGTTRSVPGVASAACSPAIPVGFRALTAVIDDRSQRLSVKERIVHKNVITPDWFRTLGTGFVAGRDFTFRDRAGAPRVAIVNRAFASRFLKDRSPLGELVFEDQAPEEDIALEIVGLVEDAVYRSVREPAPPTIYVPLSQDRRANPFPFFNVVVRPSGRTPASLVASVTAAIQSVSPDLVLAVRPMNDQVSATFNQERVIAVLASVFGASALFLAALGLYGLAAYTVSRRRHEIGLRMALGANASAVVQTVLAHMAVLVMMGIGIGCALSFWSMQFVQSLLFGVSATEPSLFGLAAGVLLITALTAGFVPAWRAARLDPARALRDW
jgi:predicted permease